MDLFGHSVSLILLVTVFSCATLPSSGAGELQSESNNHCYVNQVNQAA